MSELNIMDAEDYCRGSFSVGKIIWDKDNPDEIEAARKQFDSLLKKGHFAFTVDEKGAEKQIKQFDPNVGKIFFAPILHGG
jgi:hypothetical protein